MWFFPQEAYDLMMPEICVSLTESNVMSAVSQMLYAWWACDPSTAGVGEAGRP